jgi:hypothetical protein
MWAKTALREPAYDVNDPLPYNACTHAREHNTAWQHYMILSAVQYQTAPQNTDTGSGYSDIAINTKKGVNPKSTDLNNPHLVMMFGNIIGLGDKLLNGIVSLVWCAMFPSSKRISVHKYSWGWARALKR